MKPFSQVHQTGSRASHGENSKKEKEWFSPVGSHNSQECRSLCGAAGMHVQGANVQAWKNPGVLEERLSIASCRRRKAGAPEGGMARQEPAITTSAHFRKLSLGQASLLQLTFTTF